MRLDELASVIRSKNAGPCLLTLDLIFPDSPSYERASAAVAHLTREVAVRYRLADQEVRVFVYAPALAVKITIPRDHVAGDVGDSDIYGAQQHGPLLGIEL